MSLFFINTAVLIWGCTRSKSTDDTVIETQNTTDSASEDTGIENESECPPDNIDEC